MAGLVVNVSTPVGDTAGATVNRFAGATVSMTKSTVCPASFGGPGQMLVAHGLTV